jgi:hypothetical protein
MMPQANSNFDRPMKFQRINKSHVYLIILTLILGRIIWVIFDDRESRLRAEQQQFLTNQKQTIWPIEDAERAVASQQKTLEIRRMHANTEVKALGGNLEAAAKNPALDIQQMLEQTAIACAPIDAEISVTVDRFTEFDVALVLPDPLSFTQLAEISKSFLKNNFPYVSSVRFIQGNELLAQMDGTTIESVTNWNDISMDSVERLLITANSQNQPAARAVAGNNENPAHPTDENLDPEQTKINGAQSKFNKHFREQVDSLQKLVADLDQAARLNSNLNQDHFQSRFTWLDQITSHISSEREFFLNQSAEMEHLLKDQGLDPLLINIVTRGVSDRTQAETSIFVNLFNAISAYQEQIRTFLAEMKEQEGEWDIDLNTQLIQFTTSAARDKYVLGSNLVANSAGMVQQAFQAWANYKPSK